MIAFLPLFARFFRIKAFVWIFIVPARSFIGPALIPLVHGIARLIPGIITACIPGPGLRHALSVGNKPALSSGRGRTLRSGRCGGSAITRALNAPGKITIALIAAIVGRIHRLMRIAFDSGIRTAFPVGCMGIVTMRFNGRALLGRFGGLPSPWGRLRRNRRLNYALSIRRSRLKR